MFKGQAFACVLPGILALSGLLCTTPAFSQGPDSRGVREAYAILIEGGGINTEETLGFHNDITLAGLALQKLGVKKSNIWTFTPGPDQSKELVAQLDALVKKLEGQTGNQILVILSGHGGSHSFGLDFSSPGDPGILNYDYLKITLRPLVQNHQVAMIVSACFSGSAIDPYGRDSLAIFTSSKQNDFSCARYWERRKYFWKYKYSDFIYNYFSALIQQHPDGTRVDSDINGDGVVSLSEAFESVTQDPELKKLKAPEGEAGFFPQRFIPQGMSDFVIGQFEDHFYDVRRSLVGGWQSDPRHPLTLTGGCKAQVKPPLALRFSGNNFVEVQEWNSESNSEFPWIEHDLNINGYVASFTFGTKPQPETYFRFLDKDTVVYHQACAKDSDFENRMVYRRDFSK